jgi:predicted nucleic acid-binding protein
MPTNADTKWAVDTSVAVPALDAAHAAHDVCLRAARQHRPALAGHAAFETFSVLTRMHGPLSIDSATATAALEMAFPDTCWLKPTDAARLLARIGPMGIVGGMVYDALVAEAALRSGRRLLTRDARAVRTYDLIGVDYVLVD